MFFPFVQASLYRAACLRNAFTRAALITFLLCAGAIQPQVSAQPALQFLQPRRLTNNEFAFSLTTTNGYAYRVDASSNLLDWNPIVTLPGVKGKV